MKKSVLYLVVFTFFSIGAKAQEPLRYFLPTDVNYNSAIPTPEKFFKQPVGQWHLTHDQILAYVNEIAGISDRAVVAEYGRTYENRPLIHIIFTSPENQKKLGQLKELHRKFSEPDSHIAIDGVPLVVNLGYNVHGNESSASNSSVLTIYYLAAATGPKIESLLSGTIILVDPCLNPDGLTRHSTWANQNQSLTDMPYAESRQFAEAWPGGRTNHYWFDLNRDYLLLVNPESVGRVAKIHEWKPNIVTDHHEMGANNTFFFQPGVPKRNNPLTPEKNYTLTRKIAAHHSHFLDSIGSFYYSEEQYDDYYFGKGSSYPDINGGIGILFEQAGFRGRTRETTSGIRPFAFAIRNQFSATLSTLEAATELHDELLLFQKEFTAEALKLAEADPVKAYIFGDDNDRAKTAMFVDFLNKHKIEVLQVSNDIKKDSHNFRKESSFMVPAKQVQYRLIKTIFEEVTKFADTVFYDVSTWTVPYAWDIPFARLNDKELQQSKSQTEAVSTPAKTGKPKVTGSQYAYLFRWNEYTAPQALNLLLQNRIKAKVATGIFTMNIDGMDEEFTYGTIMIPVEGQEKDAGELLSQIQNISDQTGIGFYPVKSGYTPTGIDLGSGFFIPVDKPEVAMVVGTGVLSGGAGEFWHLFDQQYKMPVCLIDAGNVRSTSLDRFNTLILPGGSLSSFDKPVADKIREWLQAGNTLIACQESAEWAAKNGFGKTVFKPTVRPDSSATLRYADQESEQAKNVIDGAIFQTELDLTHPLCYGYARNNLPVFKAWSGVAESLKQAYAEPVRFTEKPYISGYVSPQNLNRIKNAPVVSVQSIGRGKLISFYEDPDFRGYWLGTNKLFINAVFFGNIIR